MKTREPMMPLSQFFRRLKWPASVALPALRAQWPRISHATEVSIGQHGANWTVVHLVGRGHSDGAFRKAIHEWTPIAHGNRTLLLAYDPTLNLLGHVGNVRQADHKPVGRPRIHPIKVKANG